MPVTTPPPAGYTAYYITVSLKGDVLVFDPDELTISALTTATITWVADVDDFKFKEFSWSDKRAFLSEPIRSERSIVAVVHNHSTASKGDWTYQVAADLKKSKSGANDATIQADGRPVIRTQ